MKSIECEVGKVVNNNYVCQVKLIVKVKGHKWLVFRLNLMKLILAGCVKLKLFPMNVEFIVKEKENT